MPTELIERKWREAYRRFYLRPHRIVRTLNREDFWLNLRRTFKVARRTLCPRQTKTKLKRAIAATHSPNRAASVVE